MTPRPLLGAGLVLGVLLLACGAEDDPRFLSPAVTFRHFRQSVAAGDAAEVWACLAPGYRSQLHGTGPQAWQEFLQTPDGRRLMEHLPRLEIVAEKRINDRVAYLQFDPTTVTEGSSPFYYFLHEPDGWKITTHMDSLFRDELEAAIQHGDLALPGPR